MKRAGLAVAAAALWTTGASAEVVSTGEYGFEVRSSEIIAADANDLYAALLDVSKWWDPAHTYSGDAANLSMEGEAGGCFCERWPGGSIEHLRILYAAPGKALRGTGALGPLQEMAAGGTMTWSIEPRGTGTLLVQTYRVAGNFTEPAAKLAPLVDGVLAGQAARLKRYAEAMTAAGKP